MNITEGLSLMRIYYVRGASKTRWRTDLRYAVKEPPTAGWQHALIIHGDKRSTILDPYTFESYTVPNSCAELVGAEEPRMPDTFQAKLWLADHLPAAWADLQRMGFQRDYDTVALVLKKLDLPVPKQIMVGGEEDSRRKGGKAVESELKKPVKLSSKRGKFLAWFLEAEDGARSVREAMAEFGMSRSNALSYLYMLKKDHGLGYELVGDVAAVSLTAGCDDPFDPPGEWQGTPPTKAPEATQEADKDLDDILDDEPESVEDDDDDSWLD